MKVLVCGSSGCIGSAVTAALRSRGHQVVEGQRHGGLRIDFMAPVAPQAWAARLRELHVEAVVNCVGLLMERDGQRFERVHAQGPIELFRGAALAGVQRVVQVSALGARPEGSAYLASKAAADEALLALPLQATVLRPSLVYGPGSASTRLFATLATLPVLALPGGGTQPLRPLHVYELAEMVVRCIERPAAACGVFELGGGDTALSYREMLATYRRALGMGAALWLPLPMALMKAGAWLAEALPQQVFCRETLALLACGNVPGHNSAAQLLGRAPTALAAGLAISPPQPWWRLQAQLSPALERLLRAALALAWCWAAALGLVQGGFGAVATLWGALGAALGLGTLLRPGAQLYACQCVALLLGAAAAGPTPQLPWLAVVLLLWQATPAGAAAPRRALTRHA
jgi:uncharacterized protein YbjT (DUF2867 family)